MIEFARLAAAAYTTPPTIGRESSAARAVVSPGGVVSFPGTNNIACWLADLHASTKYVPGMGMVHAGFEAAFWSIQDDLMKIPDVTITVGHSEGAALAILFGAALCLAGRPPVAVYAFEPPRVSADDTLKALFSLHGVQLTFTQHGADVVPLVPRICADWQHATELTVIGKPSWPFPNVDDHFMSGVIAALSATI